MALAKKNAGRKKGDPEGVVVASVVDKKAEQVEALPKSKRRRMTSARLRLLAAKHKPPQTWYEKNEDDLH